MTADLVDIWWDEVLRRARLGSLLLGEHASQVENWLTSEPDAIGIVYDLALVLSRPE